MNQYKRIYNSMFARITVLTRKHMLTYNCSYVKTHANV